MAVGSPPTAATSPDSTEQQPRMAGRPVPGQSQTSLHLNASTAHVARTSAAGELGTTQKGDGTATRQSSSTTPTGRHTTVQSSRRGKKQQGSEQFESFPLLIGRSRLIYTAGLFYWRNLKRRLQRRESRVTFPWKVGLYL